MMARANPKLAMRPFLREDAPILAAIFAADVAGYSRLMGQDEAATVRDLKAHEAVPPAGNTAGT